MLALNSITRKLHFRLVIIFLLFIFFQGCKVYQEPLTIEQAVIREVDGYLKVTMLNGDKFIYENIEVIEDSYYGINFNDEEKIIKPINTDQIKDIQRRNEKSSKSSNFIGISIGVLTILIGSLML